MGSHQTTEAIERITRNAARRSWSCSAPEPVYNAQLFHFTACGVLVSDIAESLSLEESIESLEDSFHDAEVVILRQHHIPLSKFDLIGLLGQSKQLSEQEQVKFRQFCKLLGATFHYEYHTWSDELKKAYAHFNPDAEQEPLRKVVGDEREQQSTEFFERFSALMDKANFRKLSQQEIDHAVSGASAWGLRLDVDFSVFRRLDVYARGELVAKRMRRDWREFYRNVEVELPMHQRLVVVFRLHDHPRIDSEVDTEAIYTKIFKNIPKQDVDMLLPGTRVRMTLVDQSRILLPTVSGLALAIFKIVKGAVALVFTGIWGILAFAAFVLGTLGYGLKSVFGYLHTKDKYQLNLTRNLYFKNLGNNNGVLFHLLHQAEEQETCEALLAYFLLWRKPPGEGWTAQELDHQAELLLKEEAGIDADFHVHDALRKLFRLGLAEMSRDRRLTAKPIDEALRRLDEEWDDYFLYNDRPPSTGLPELFGPRTRQEVSKSEKDLPDNKHQK